VLRSPRARLLGALAVAAVLVAGAVIAISLAGDDDEGESSSRVDASRTVYLRSSLAQALRGVRKEAGGEARLNRLTLSDYGAEFYMTAKRDTTGYLAQPPDYGDAQAFRVGLNRKVLRSTAPFSIAQVDPAVPERLVQAIQRRHRARKVKLLAGLLERKAGADEPVWIVDALVDGQPVRYRAGVDGSRPRPDRETVRRQRALRRSKRAEERAVRRNPEHRESLRQARAISKCIERAQGDQKKIQQCTENMNGGK
jgi:hypothetical protein